MPAPCPAPSLAARSFALPLLLGAGLTLGLAAQVPPGPAMPQDTKALAATPAAGGAADQRWQIGRQALTGSDPSAAIPHLLAALEFHPDSPALLLDLVRATAGTADAQALWGERFVRAAADGQGRTKLDAAARKLLPAATVAMAGKLVELRAATATELLRAIEKRKPAGSGTTGNAVVAGCLAEVALAVMQDAPGLLSAQGPAFAKALATYTPDYDAVLEALLRTAAQPPVARSQDPAADPAVAAAAARSLAVRALRIAEGLCRQATFKDLKGPPPPDLTAHRAAASKLDAALRGEVAANARVFTVDELRALSPIERDAFTLAHRDPARPGVAMSPGGKYRLETVCGFETLLGAAETVELHHARLAAHYGSDPFADRPGLVRIVPEHADLETDGAPFWWAGGFQAGDTTTLRFAWGSIPALGRGLTHELTHRFDGVLHAFCPSWYVEGHAVWTGGHYALMADRDFTAGALQVGTVASTLSLGYGDPGKFERLLAGTIEEYRDNYTAGYALYAFLREWPPLEPPRFRSALERFEKNARGGQKDPVKYFTTTICDGKDGRPAALEAFVVQWQKFLRDCYDWLDKDKRTKDNAWLAGYRGIGDGDPAPMVLDEPTWSWARSRHEPYFGQDHAAAAALVLQEAGERAAAVAACLWALQVDGWRHPVAAALPVLLQDLALPDAAAAAAALARLRYPDAVAPAAEPSRLLAQLPRTKALLDALDKEIGARLEKQHLVAAASLRAERDRIGALLGLAATPAAPAFESPPPPSVPRLLGGFGFTESELAGYDDHRVPKLWFATPDGDLHVGREQPRDGTGQYDRTSLARQAFVHTVEWLGPGHYTVRARIHPTTAFVAGALIVGHARRDRGVRVSFSSGDWNWATGGSAVEDRVRKVHLSLAGMWERDGKLPGTDLGGYAIDLGANVASFTIELQVRGASVLVKANGEAVFRYTTHDGAPIEGHLGFAMSQGAIRVQQPTVQRRDDESPRDRPADLGLDVARQPGAELDDLLGLRTRGLPCGPCGTLVLWLPKPAEDVDAQETQARLARALLEIGKVLAGTWEHPQIWVLAVPKNTAARVIDDAQARVQDLGGPVLRVVEHEVGAPLSGSDPWLLFVDAAGVLRGAAGVREPGVHVRVERWARLFRAR